jgi:hypothetical protein
VDYVSAVSLVFAPVLFIVALFSQVVFSYNLGKNPKARPAPVLPILLIAVVLTLGVVLSIVGLMNQFFSSWATCC